MTSEDEHLLDAKMRSDDPAGAPASPRRRWSDVFRVSPHTPVVFRVASDFESEVLERLSAAGLPEVVNVSLFSNTYRSTALLDGLVIELDNYSFPFGGLQSGLRVVGTRPMRLLAHLLGLTPPKRRLKGEDAIPSLDELFADLEAQTRLPKSALEERARKGLGVADRTSLFVLVRELYGERYVPPPDAALKRQLATAGDWGTAGFTMYDAEYLQSIGMSLDEAKEWQLALDWDDFSRISGVEQLGRLRTYGLDRLLPWLAAGFPTWSATAFIDRGTTLDEVKPFLDVGCPPGLVIDFLKGNLGPDAYVEYEQAGIHPQWFAAAGMRAVDAIAWQTAGFYSGLAAALYEGGVTLAEASEMKANGMSDDQIKAHIRRQGPRTAE